MVKNELLAKMPIVYERRCEVCGGEMYEYGVVEHKLGDEDLLFVGYECESCGHQLAVHVAGGVLGSIEDYFKGGFVDESKYRRKKRISNSVNNKKEDE